MEFNQPAQQQQQQQQNPCEEKENWEKFVERHFEKGSLFQAVNKAWFNEYQLCIPHINNKQLQLQSQLKLIGM